MKSVRSINRLFTRFLALSVLVLGGVHCGVWASTEEGDTPPRFFKEVNTSSKHYLTEKAEASFSFTGVPATDFKSTRRIYSDPTNDVTSVNPTAADIEIGDIYVAFSDFNLYIGHKTDVFTERTEKMGAFYIYIDNNLSEADDAQAGWGPNALTGSGYRFLDDVGTVASNGKFSVYIKHWRPYARDVTVYYFTKDNKINRERISSGSDNTVGWMAYSMTNVTELTIPLRYIYGENVVKVPQYLNLAFRCDAFEKDYPGNKVHLWDAAPNENQENWITNWIQLEIGATN